MQAEGDGHAEGVADVEECGVGLVEVLVEVPNESENRDEEGGGGGAKVGKKGEGLVEEGEAWGP